MVLISETTDAELFRKLGPAYTLAASRLANLIQAEEQLVKNSSSAGDWAGKVLAVIDRASAQGGQYPIHAAGLETEPDGLGRLERGLQHELAGVRCVLRRTIRLAEVALARRDAAEYPRLAEVYGQAYSRLLRVLRATPAMTGYLPS